MSNTSTAAFCGHFFDNLWHKASRSSSCIGHINIWLVLTPIGIQFFKTSTSFCCGKDNYKLSAENFIFLFSPILAVLFVLPLYQILSSLHDVCIFHIFCPLKTYLQTLLFQDHLLFQCMQIFQSCTFRTFLN